MQSRQLLEKVINNVNLDTLDVFFRGVYDRFTPQRVTIQVDSAKLPEAESATQVGYIHYDTEERLIVVATKLKTELTSRSGKKRQYEFAKNILKSKYFDAGIFIFFDHQGHFRFSLVVTQYAGSERKFSNFRRYTYFVSPGQANKTFLNQISHADFSSLEGLLAAFSLEAVSNEFYNDFKPKFDLVAAAVHGTDDADLKQDFALLFVIRIIFLGFVQKKGWLGGKEHFIREFWEEYKERKKSPDTFYSRWLEPLFFEALSSPPGRKVKYGNNEFSDETEHILQNAPYLNGELFKEKKGVDDQGLWLPDQVIGDFLGFLFQYNFTIEENRLYDEELELNPEFLGLIFERLTNKDAGAVYTPRVEVDFMCRIALVKWLQKKNICGLQELYTLFFREGGSGEEYDEIQKQGDFSSAEIRQLVEALRSVTVCDPAAGSGAFEVGMLHVLEEILENLTSRNNTPEELKGQTAFERKKEIIANSLYGVEVKHWAVWINQLRLWLTLFIDMPEKYRDSLEPLLPSLNFKIRCGDSLVQRIGSKMFPVHGHAEHLPASIKRKITELKKEKVAFFHNKGLSAEALTQKEIQIFREILDAEIAEKRKALQGPFSIPKEQKDLFGAPDLTPQLRLQITEENKKRLRAEIDELEDQKRSLKDDHPLIWSIEFAEIFFDRGGFDIIIGNPPYVRQEDIADPNGLLQPPKAYKNALQETVLLDYPHYFGKSAQEPHLFKKGRKPSGKSDLYVYFYLRTLYLLNPQGVHIFICSNSWLDVGYGAWMQEFLLRNVPMHFIFDNHAKRSFSSADVNTIITVFDAPARNRKANKASSSRSMIKFVAFKQPFEEVILSQNLWKIENAETILKCDAFRVYPISAEKLLAEGSESEEGKSPVYVGDKWGGKYLRAPDIFFTILEKGKGKLVKLKDVAKVRFGIKTGANDFFYLTPLGPGSRPGLLRVRNGAGWEGEIEEEFLKPVIKSPRECRSILLKPEELKFRLFMCNQSKHELQGTKALRYIEWGEQAEIEIKQGKDKGKKIIGFQNLETVKNRILWWAIGKRKHSFLHFNYLVYDTGKTFIGHFYASDNFHDIYSTKDYSVSLNSIVFFLFQNVFGRANFGGGLMKIQTYELKRLMLLDIETKVHDNLSNIKYTSIFTECGIDPTSPIPISKQEPDPLPDRKALDDIVFDALDLNAEERKEVYRAVCQLVWNRISKAKSV